MRTAGYERARLSRSASARFNRHLKFDIRGVLTPRAPKMSSRPRRQRCARAAFVGARSAYRRDRRAGPACRQWDRLRENARAGRARADRRGAAHHQSARPRSSRRFRRRIVSGHPRSAPHADRRADQRRAYPGERCDSAAVPRPRVGTEYYCDGPCATTRRSHPRPRGSREALS